MKKKCIYTFLVCFILNHSEAQWSEDPKQNNAICIRPNDQVRSQAVSDGKGGIIITWTDERISTINSDIYAQRIDANGVRKWALNGIAVCTESQSQREPRICSDGAGGAIIVWVDDRGSFTDLYAQRVDSNGNVLWALNGRPVIQAPRYQQQAAIIEDGEGGAFIVWEDTRNLQKADIYAQHISSTGTRLWTTEGIPIALGKNQQSDIFITTDATGGILIAWTDARLYPSDNTDIYAQHVSANGNILWAVNGNAIVSSLSGQYLTDMIVDGQGGAFLAFLDYSDTQNADDVYVQRLNSNGTGAWGVGGLPVCVLPNSQSDAKIIADGRGGVILAWHDLRGGGDYDGDIYAQRINSNGQVRWTNNGNLVAKAFRYRLHPHLVPNGNGGAVICYSDYRNEGTSIYAQQINAAGQRLWGLGGVAVCTVTKSRFLNSIVSDQRGGAILTWQDYRNGEFANGDIFASRIKTTTTAPASESIKSTQIIQLLPNPATNAIRLSGVLNEQSFMATIVNKTGQTFISPGMIKKDQWIDVSGLKADLYYLRLEDRDGKIQLIPFVKE